MRTYKVVTVSPEEYRKADLDWSYSPQEEVHGRITAATERKAKNALKRGIANNTYPAGAELVEDDLMARGLQDL
jgi:hypothetical protein